MPPISDPSVCLLSSDVLLRYLSKDADFAGVTNPGVTQPSVYALRARGFVHNK